MATTRRTPDAGGLARAWCTYCRLTPHDLAMLAGDSPLRSLSAIPSRLQLAPSIIPPVRRRGGTSLAVLCRLPVIQDANDAPRLAH